MREIDTETPVVWPAWCYSGEATTEDATPQQASSPHQTQTINNTSNSIINNNRGKRKNVSPALISGTSPSSSISTSLTSATLTSIDKMLNDRMMVSLNNNISNNNNNNNIDNNNKKFCDNGNNVLINNNNNSSSNNNLFYDTVKQESNLDISLKYNGDLTNNINSSSNNNNNSNSNSNNNSIKNERLSPSNNNNHNVNNFNTNGEQSSASRSRSATPSSYPGTPPQGLNSIDLQNNLSMQQQQQQQTAAGQRPEIPGRNYSDFMRSLAAKYNNQNDSKNLFFDPRLNINSLKSTTKETFPTTPEAKKQQTTNAAAAAAVANAAQHLTNMSSLFSGLPFPPGVFTPPIIDMSSTQALITLARAAKEAEIQSILKGSNPSLLKRNSNSVNSNNNNNNVSPRNLSPNTQNHLGTPKIPNFQINPGFSLANFHQQMSNIANSTATSPSNNHNTSNNSSSNTLNNSNSSNNGGENITTTPLDLSSSTTLVAKQSRIDDMGSRATVSPVLSTKSNSSETKQYLGGYSGGTPSQNLQHVPSPSPTAVRRCQAQSEEINSWSVEQVCEFVGGIDICAEYVQNFRDQQIDGTGLPLLTEEHLTNSLGLKLGPALKLKSILAKKLGGPCPCVSCSTGLNTSTSSNHSGGAIKKEFSMTNSVLNNIPWPSSAESES